MWLKGCRRKGSDNHSWRYNLTPGMYSIENCGHNKTRKSIYSFIGCPRTETNIYFIDIDYSMDVMVIDQMYQMRT